MSLRVLATQYEGSSKKKKPRELEYRKIFCAEHNWNLEFSRITAVALYKRLPPPKRPLLYKGQIYSS